MPSCVPKRTKIRNVVAQRNYILNTNTYNCLINFRFPGRNTCGYPANICSVLAPTIFQNQYVCAHTDKKCAHQHICINRYMYVKGSTIFYETANLMWFQLNMKWRHSSYNHKLHFESHCKDIECWNNFYKNTKSTSL